MQGKWMAAVALSALMVATGVARAQEATDIEALKAQAAALKKQNADLEKRLNKLEQKQTAAAPVAAPAPASSDFMGMVTKGPLDVITDEGPLTWHGITLYGAYDIGAGWVSHGIPENGVNYEGEGLVNKNGNRSMFLLQQNSLSQTGLGIKGTEEFFPGWSAIFNASTGINPQSGQLANMAATNTMNNGLPRSAYSYVGDGARAGQAFNDELYAGVSSHEWGALTFGRQRSLGTDAVLEYDPAGGAYAFSFIGYNGLTAGGGDTQDTRWDDALKYRVTYGPVHFGAMYKFVDGNAGCYDPAAIAGNSWTAASCQALTPHNDAFGFNFGGVYNAFSADVVVQHVNQAISVVNPLLGPGTLAKTNASLQSTTNQIDTTPITGTNVINPNNTLYGIVTDNTSVMLTAKYTWDQFKVFGGYEYILMHNPANPLGIGASAQGGYLLSGVEDNNLDSPKEVQVFWTGVKYAYDEKTDITLSYYHELQNTFFRSGVGAGAGGGCPSPMYRSSCSGTLDEVSLYVDHHFTKRFDVYAGFAYSDVTNGLAVAIPHNGAGGVGVPYYYDNNFAPTVGVRYRF